MTTTYGLSNEGFIAKPLALIKSDIESRLKVISPTFDLSPESPDGQIVGIASGLTSLLWQELDKVYNSYNPHTATGQALQNIGLLTGVTTSPATKSTATVSLIGAAGVFVPRGSLVSNVAGDEFYTNADSATGADVTVIAKVAGVTPVPAGSIVNVDSTLVGWEGVTQSTDGRVGVVAQDEQQYRNLRNRTVLRNGPNSEDVLYAGLIGTGVRQVLVVNNDTAVTLPDGTPPRGLHVTVGEINGVDDDEIGKAIFENKAIGVVTYGSTVVNVPDNNGHTHVVKFSKSTAAPISVLMTIKYTTDDYAGAEEGIKKDVAEFINDLLVGEDVVWSHLFNPITRHGGAQVNELKIGTLGSEVASNFVIADNEFAAISISDIVITVVTS